MPSVSKPQQRVMNCPHVQRRAYALGLCNSCYVMRWRSLDSQRQTRHQRQRNEHYRKNIAEENSRTAMYYQVNKERLKSAARKRWESMTSEQRWERNLKAAHHITAAEYYALVDRQNNKCAICEQSPKAGTELVVDHCHTRKQVRGLLCGHCNIVLGILENNQSILERAITYARYK